MPEHLNPDDSLSPLNLEEQAELRALTRSPHPYHHLRSDLPHASHRLVYRSSLPTTPKSDDGSGRLSPFPAFSKESSPASDSGTEADDEHFLKGLPAPKVRSHKGIRGRNEPLSGTSTPVLSPAILEEDGRNERRKAKQDLPDKSSFFYEPNYRRTKELIRRGIEFAIVGVLVAMLKANSSVGPIITTWSRELGALVFLNASLMLLYPIRLIAWTYRHRNPSKWPPIAIPRVFDPAAILYPPAITMLVSFLVSADNPAVILPNIILSISSIPRLIVPTARSHDSINAFHWALSCIPLLMTSSQSNSQGSHASISGKPVVAPETAVLLYPLHETVLVVLHYLTTTSLLTAELQLLSIALINVLLLSYSPQANILKALLWVGGVGVLVTCGPVVRWGIALARVPRLRFRRATIPTKTPSILGLLAEGLSIRRFRHELFGSSLDDSSYETMDSEEDLGDGTIKKPLRVRTFAIDGVTSQPDDTAVVSPSDKAPESLNGFSHERRNTFPILPNRPRRSATHTSSGRRKRAASMTIRSFFKLTYAQATARKWVYAAYVYICLAVIILLPVREYISRYALVGEEPIGWGLGYAFGDLPWFRFNVVSANLERWICLPPRHEDDPRSSCHLGWVQHVRFADFGEANTRLLLSAYWVVVLIVGLTVVIRLDAKYEVDTRRKVFHFMMVAMLLPSIFIDPVYVSLVLSLVLAIFLILDLLRASQLPPLSKPIANFLTPYVDGRDHKGPVVISHIFLLIGCAIPLWLTLATLPRTGSDYLVGWEVPTREVSMVAGVVCVGLGDAAASLIGRRFGHRKWVWGGGKSLEGSVAFAAAVFLGLMAASAWLRLGGWPVTAGQVSLAKSAGNSAFCASMSSLTEAALTGGNDNVIVPVVLWTCTKSLGI